MNELSIDNNQIKTSGDKNMKYTVLFGRILFSIIFLSAALGHFSQKTISFAAAAGVPFASIAVPFSGVLALVGGLSVVLGYKAKWGSWLLVLFLVPVTIIMHNFWAAPDPMTAQMQQAMFFKNISMLGASLIIAYFGSGPLSLDEYVKNHAHSTEKNKKNFNNNSVLMNK
jgi:putative oxidoreductase